MTVPEFWQLGYKLFNDSPSTFPVPFIAGDAFSPSHIGIPTTPMSTSRPANLSGLTSLNPLRGHVSAIHASSFFHLFNEEKQAYLAKALACLLSPEPGSMIFGSHLGAPQPMERMAFMGIQRFCHSPESWAKLWDGEIFEKGTVKVDATLQKYDLTRLGGDDVPGREFHLFSWCLTRL